MTTEPVAAVICAVLFGVGALSLIGAKDIEQIIAGFVFSLLGIICFLAVISWKPKNSINKKGE